MLVAVPRFIHLPVSKPKILLVCGGMHQTEQMYKIARFLGDFDCWYTPFYSTEQAVVFAQEQNLIEGTFLGNALREKVTAWLTERGCQQDYKARLNKYELVVTCADMLRQDNIARIPSIMVQEGMIDRLTMRSELVQLLGLPKWFNTTSALQGRSGSYRKLCVGSEGYRQYYLKLGIPDSKLVITGIPNYDDLDRYRTNDFPHRGYVLVATSDIREVYNNEDRPAFLRRVRQKHGTSRPYIFKLHPNEVFSRAEREIKAVFPDALVLQEGNTYEMIANCDVLVTQWSTVTFAGIIFGKEIDTFMNLHLLRRLCPVQNGGASAENIAGVVRQQYAVEYGRMPEAVENK